MAIGPIDYTLQVKDPFKSAMQGYNFGSQIINDIEQQKAIEEAKKQAEATAQAKAQLQEEINAIANNPNASNEDLRRVMLKGIPFGKEYVQTLKESFDVFKQRDVDRKLEEEKQILIGLSENPTPENILKTSYRLPQFSQNIVNTAKFKDDKDKDAMFSELVQINTALKNGRPDFALQQIDSKITAMENSGQDANHLKALRQQIELNPKAATAMTGAAAAAVDRDKYAAVMGVQLNQNKDAREEQMQHYEIASKEAGVAKTYTDIAQTQQQTRKATIEADLFNKYGEQQIRADLATKESNVQKTLGETELQNRKYNLDYDKFNLDKQKWEYERNNTKLSPKTEEALLQISEKALLYKTNAQQAGELANYWENSNKWGGIGGELVEKSKDFFGQQDETSNMLIKTQQMVSKYIMGSLPPGAASDKDIAFAQKGAPNVERASPSQLASYSRGVEKTNYLNAVAEEVKADWINANNGLGNSKKDLKINGVNIPQGTSFKKYLDSQIDMRYNELVGKRALDEFADYQ